MGTSHTPPTPEVRSLVNERLDGIANSARVLRDSLEAYMSPRAQEPVNEGSADTAPILEVLDSIQWILNDIKDRLVL